MSAKEVLKWIMEQEQDESIVQINRDQLQEMIENEDFVAVIFCKYQDKHRRMNS